MLETVRQLAVVSRAEFLLPNLGSLIMGLAWGASPLLSFPELLVLVVLSFTVINLSSAIGAQVNTISDYELDVRNYRKRELVEALRHFGQGRLKKVLAVELVVTLCLVVGFMLVNANPVLLLLWVVGISLGCGYSAPPLRIKSRSWLAPVTLILVLAIFPLLFAYLTFTSSFEPVFLLILAGLASTVYAVIIPTEIRDYFEDKAMGIETMTIRLGLVRASLLGILLLSLGGVLIGTGFLITFVSGPFPVLGILVAAVALADSVVVWNLLKLYKLSAKYENSEGQNSIAHEITSLSAKNPKWIMLVTQTYSILSIILLIAKFVQ
jgi:4-hydroxybenzoate polyprenyltransferase